MKTTYMVLYPDGEVAWYHTRLKDAKKDLLDQNDKVIVMMRGLYFGEGFHKYKMKYINGKFKKEKP